MLAPIFLKGVPEMIIRSASRGVLRKTSAPKRAISKRGVMLVIISTKQHDRPKNIGQRLFLRPQLMASSKVVSMTFGGNSSLMMRSLATCADHSAPCAAHAALAVPSRVRRFSRYGPDQEKG